MSDLSNDKIMEERKEHMVSRSPTGNGGDPTLRIAHFLTPSVADVDGPVFDLSPPVNGFNFIHDKKKSNLIVHFSGWRHPQKDWKTWTDRMHSLHHSAWKKAGIYDAIMNSACRIHRNNDLMHGFAQKWHPETNTFVFPWGEATITLEDMMILGGFSVLGHPVFSPVKNTELEAIEKKLLLARSELSRTKCKKPTHNLWLPKFMDSGSEIEHEAFLALWLSRFVFPSKSRGDTVQRNVLPIAIHLARGTKIALAPAVLANLYENLSDMKDAIIYSKRMEQENIFELCISAPFQLVQIWVWERFPNLQPNFITFEHDQPRFAKWNDLRIEDVGDVKLAIDEASNYFNWRPYAKGCGILLPHRIYKENAECVLVGSGMDEEQEVLVRWLRVSELAGVDSDCIKQYLPHRVALQFGFDQDLPGHVSRANSSQLIAWKNYTREIKDERLYVPSRYFESNVTTRYREWWKKSMSSQSCDAVKTSVGELICEGLKENLLLNSFPKKSVNDASSSADLSGKSNGSEFTITNSLIPESVGKGVLLNSAGNESQNDVEIFSSIPARPDADVAWDSHDRDRQIGANRFGEGTHGKGIAPNMFKLTGSEYKKALVNRMSHQSLGERELPSSSADLSGKSNIVIASGSEFTITNRAIAESVGKGVLLNSAGKESHDDVQIFSSIPAKPDTDVAWDSHDRERRIGANRMVEETHGKGIAPNMVKLTGLEYKKALVNRMNHQSLGERELPSSSGKKLENDTFVFSCFPPKPNSMGMRNSEDDDGQHQTKQLRNGSDGKKKALKVGVLTASEYKKTLAIRMSPMSLGKRTLRTSVGNRSDNDAVVPPGFRPRHTTFGTRDLDDRDGPTQAKCPRNDSDNKYGSQRDSGIHPWLLLKPDKSLAIPMSPKSLEKRTLLTSVGNRSENDADVPPGFHPRHSTIGKRDLEFNSGREAESGPGVHGFSHNVSSLESEGSETQPSCHQPFRPSSQFLIKPSNGAEATNDKKLNFNPRDGKNCSSRAFEDVASELYDRIRNLERLLAEYKGG